MCPKSEASPKIVKKFVQNDYPKGCQNRLSKSAQKLLHILRILEAPLGSQGDIELKTGEKTKQREI